MKNQEKAHKKEGEMARRRQRVEEKFCAKLAEFSAIGGGLLCVPFQLLGLVLALLLGESSDQRRVHRTVTE